MSLFQAILLSILLVSNSLRISFIYGWYALDLDSFVEQLCENKERPQLQCNGKCYLSKMTAENSKEDPSSAPTIKWEQPVFKDAGILTLPDAESVVYHKNIFYYLFQFSDTPLSTIFHPPRTY